MNKKFFRLLAILLGVISILLVVYLWVTNQRNKVFIAALPMILASVSQRHYKKININKRGENMMKNKIKVVVALSAISSLSLPLLSGCSAKNNNTPQNNYYGEFLRNTGYSLEKDVQEVPYDELKVLGNVDGNSTRAMSSITKKDNLNFYQGKHTRKVIRTQVDNLLKIDVNIIYNEQNEVELAYLKKYISPKATLVYDNVTLEENHNHKFEAVGEIKILKENLTEEELSSIEQYASSYPKRISIDSSFITFTFPH